jgi:peroxiredoxin
MRKSSERGSSRRTWVICGFLAIVLLGLLAVQSCLSVGTEIGHRAPDFALADLEGNPVHLGDFRGKVVFLNFWATLCPPCLAEMPDIEKLYQEYKDKGVVIIGINLGESKSSVRNFVEENGYSWTFVIDVTGEVSIGKYMVYSIPSSFFIDRDGVIRATSVGYMRKATMEARLAEAMK